MGDIAKAIESAMIIVEGEKEAMDATWEKLNKVYRQVAELEEEVKYYKEQTNWYKTDGDNLSLMPKQGKDVLFITRPDETIKRGYWYWGDDREDYSKYPFWTDYNDDYDCDRVTHWMPLPQPPQEKE